MRCKNCSKTFRAPPPRMRESQICTQCQDMLQHKEIISDDNKIVKITTQFIDSCTKCNNIIYEKKNAYRNQSHDLLCAICGIKETRRIQNNESRKKIIRYEIEQIIQKKEKKNKQLDEIEITNKTVKTTKVSRLFRGLFKKEEHESNENQEKKKFVIFQINELEKELELKKIILTNMMNEEPIAEEPIAEEPIAEEPIAEEPIAEEPIAEEPIEQDLHRDENNIQRDEVITENKIKYAVLTALDKDSLKYIIEQLSQGKFTKKHIVRSLSMDEALLKIFYPDMFNQFSKEVLVTFCEKYKINSNGNKKELIKKSIEKSLEKNFRHEEIIFKYSTTTELNDFFKKTFKVSGTRLELINRIYFNTFLSEFAKEAIIYLSKDQLEEICFEFQLEFNDTAKNLRNKIKNKWDLESQITDVAINDDENVITEEVKHETPDENYQNVRWKNHENIIIEEVKHETPDENIKRICSKKCVNFKVKKPSTGGRYESGQARCQICDIWIDFRGAKLKNGEPATEDSLGWHCVCCNYRIRQKPRNKVYKEKLAAVMVEGNLRSINLNPCPRCGICPTDDNIESMFGMRESNGKSFRQSYCRKCRSSTFPVTNMGIENEEKEDNEDEIRKNYDEIKEKETRLEETEEDALEDVNQKIERNKSKFTSKQIDDFVNSRDNFSSADRAMLEKVVELGNQFTDESLEDIFENRYFVGGKREKIGENQRTIIRFFKIFLRQELMHETQKNNANNVNEEEPKNKIKNIEEINQLIFEALIIIGENSSGIHTSTLSKKLGVTKQEFKELSHRLLRIEDVIIKKGEGSPRIFLRSKLGTYDKRRNENETVENNDSKILKKKESGMDEEIKKIVQKMIAEHIHWKTNINKDLKIKLINIFLKDNSILAIYKEFPIYTKQKIRVHLTTDLRLPTKLKELENSGSLHYNPICSITIALYATDYFNWDGEEENIKKIIELAKSISNYLKSDSDLNRIFEGRKVS
jgi:hypothetical protein